MTFKRFSVLAFLLASLSCPVTAEDRTEHFAGKPADTLEQAVANFAEGNRQLRELLSGDVSQEDLAQIHQLSYTLENALGKMNEEMQALAVLLEQVHLGSETGKTQSVQGNARAYFNIVDTLELGDSAQ